VHTAMVLIGGLLLLGACFLLGRWLGGPGPAGLAAGAKIFLPLWLIAAAINMWFGVSRAGYTVAEELPIFLGILAALAVPAIFIWWKFG